MARVLYFTYWGIEKDSGFTLQILSEVEYLRRRGHEVVFLTGFRLFKKRGLRRRINELQGFFTGLQVPFYYFNVFGGRFRWLYQFVDR